MNDSFERDFTLCALVCQFFFFVDVLARIAIHRVSLFVVVAAAAKANTQCDDATFLLLLLLLTSNVIVACARLRLR